MNLICVNNSSINTPPLCKGMHLFTSRAKLAGSLVGSPLVVSLKLFLVGCCLTGGETKLNQLYFCWIALSLREPLGIFITYRTTVTLNKDNIMIQRFDFI